MQNIFIVPATQHGCRAKPLYLYLYGNFPQDRGLDDRTLLPYFPFRDDGFRILKVIEAMVEDYVNL